jgi:uncharacterized LabA/DUF88 family protein
MSAREKSDLPEVARKRANKAASAAAEPVERRGGAKENRPLIDWLDYNGYTVVSKPAKEFTDASGHRKVKGNMDIELAVHAMELAGHIDQMVLFSGDGDFRPVIEAVQRRGVHVTVISTMSAPSPMIADELRRQADVFTDLIELKSKIVRVRPAPNRSVEEPPLG